MNAKKNITETSTHNDNVINNLFDWELYFKQPFTHLTFLKCHQGKKKQINCVYVYRLLIGGVNIYEYFFFFFFQK